MPGYNAALTLKKTVEDIPQGLVDEIILVDDKSRDNTLEIAQLLGLTVIAHEKNRGYGGAQKSGYKLALEKGADYIVMLHPDYQYDGRLLPAAVDLLRTGVVDVVLGNRIRSRKESLSGGMPFYKYFFNRALTITANIWLGQNLGEFHSGFRAYRKEVLEGVPFEVNTDDFAFDAQFLVQAVYFNFKLGDIPMPVRYFEEASSIGWQRSVKYGLHFLLVLVQYSLNKLKILKSKIFKK